jgi:diguanylate cyclase (GGDEF)-like protein
MSLVESRWLALLTDSLPTLCWSTDRELRLTACRGAGLAGADLLRLPLQRVLNLPAGHAVLAAHARAIEGDSAACELPWQGRLFRALIEPLRDEAGEVIGAAAAAVEVRETDGPRGMLDRSRFLAALDQRLAGQAGHSDALVLLDLDGFGALNARLGHGAGDAVLAEVSRRLESHVRGTDILARTGGDEFAVVVSSPVGGDPHRIADRLREELEAPMSVGEALVRVKTSAGVVRLASHESAQVALLEAESAMSRAKADGRGRCAEWTTNVDERTASLLKVEAELRRALGRDELRVHFEPSVSVKTGRVDGFEVLLWKKGGRGTSPRPVAVPVEQVRSLV